MEVRRRHLRVRRVALAAVVAAVLVGFYLFMRSPYFALDHLRIRGYQRLDPATVRDWAGIPAGTSIWQVDPGAVARRLEAHPRVAGAVVRREWPRGLLIELQERPTAALLVEPAAARWAELDAQGRILAVGQGAPAAGLEGVPEIRWAASVRDRKVLDELATAGLGDAAGPAAGAGAGDRGAGTGAGERAGEAAPGAPAGGTGSGDPAQAAATGDPAVGAQEAAPGALRFAWEPGRFVPEPLARAAGVAAVLAGAGLPDPPRRLVVGDGPSLVIGLASGVPVHWGLLDGSVEGKVRALAAALVAAGEGTGRPAYIDVTDPDRPVLGPPGAETGAPGAH